MAKRMKVVTYRFPAELEERIGDLAEQKGMTRSDFVRDALERVVEKEVMNEKKTLLDWFGKRVGSVHSGGKFPSRDHSKIIREYLVRKHYGSRSR